MTDLRAGLATKGQSEDQEREEKSRTIRHRELPMANKLAQRRQYWYYWARDEYSNAAARR